MTTISDHFKKIKTTRPDNDQESTSIAELAQFTEFDETAQYPFANAYDNLLADWKFEARPDDRRSYLDFKVAQMLFADDSTLYFK